MDIIGVAKYLFIYLNIVIARASPYPPSFSNTAAKIIEPATGASTCALGSQRWTVNMGNFTKNAIIINIHRIGWSFINVENCSGIVIFNKLNEFHLIFIIMSRSGRDAETVYNIKYILAWIRSGWYPHNIIRSIVGIKDASNAI